MRDTGASPMNSRHDEPVQIYQTVGTQVNKALFTVPDDKVFFVELIFTAFSEGDKYIIEAQADTEPFAAVGGGEGKEGGEAINAPQFNPWGGFPAGTNIRLRREIGTSGKDWSGGYSGYLEDA